MKIETQSYKYEYSLGSFIHAYCLEVVHYYSLSCENFKQLIYCTWFWVPNSYRDMSKHKSIEEEPLKKEMATHPSILSQEIPWQRSLTDYYCPWVHKESDMTERLSTNVMFPSDTPKGSNRSCKVIKFDSIQGRIF